MDVLKWDLTGFLREIDGDLETGEELLAIFLETVPQILTEIEEALHRGDLLKACEQAHSLKGAAGTVHLEAMREEAFALETSRNPEEARRHLERLRELFKIFRQKAEEVESLRDLLV
ncbi:MAG: Hpt domain-containing protein [Thermodesulfobacteria bacterium]|nr:Hpt domain-containing protein [Thermodesulfobacteriota bacterium]